MELLAEKNPHETSGKNDSKHCRQNHLLGNEDHLQHLMRWQSPGDSWKRTIGADRKAMLTKV